MPITRTPARRAFTTTAILLTSSLLISGRASATPVTLEQLVGEVDQSPRVQRSSAMADEGSWKRVEALSGLLPTVTGGATRLLDKRYMFTDINLGAPLSIPNIVPTTMYSLGIQWTLFDGFANIDRWQGAKALERAGHDDHEWTRFQARRDVVLLFYRALASQTLKEVAEQNMKTLDEHRNDVELFRQSGISTKYDVLRVDVQTSEAKSEVLNSTDNTTIAMLRLGELLGKDLSNAQLVGELPLPNPKAMANLNPVPDNRADLNALSERVKGLGDMETAAGRYWVPKIALVGQYQRYNNRDDSYTNDTFRDAYTIGVQAGWTFDGIIGPTARDQQATSQRIQAEKALEMTQLKAKNDIETFKRRYLYFCNVHQARIEDIDRATESVRLAREGRKAGVRTNTDLLDAELELFRARAGRVNAQIGAVEALINLELATGQELYKF